MTRRLALFASMVALFLPLLSSAQPVTQPFSFNVIQHNLPAVYHGDVAWVDLDGDGDLDAIVSGSASGLLTGDIYQNDSSGDDILFTRLTTGLPGLIYSFTSAADFDGDGDVDFLIGGSTQQDHPFSPTTRLYRNDPTGFVPVEGTGLPQLHSGSASWGDLDNDGDLDLILTGVASDDSFRSVVAFNLGGGAFDVQNDILPGMGYSDTDLADIDLDGDLDLAITGATADGFLTRIYRNNQGELTAINDDLLAVAFSSVDWGDLNGDDFLDLAVSGAQISRTVFTGRTQLYRSVNANIFVPVESELADVLSGDILWGDYDNNGTNDIMMIGSEDVFGDRTGRIYKTEEGTQFRHLAFLHGTMFGSAEWGDFDGDGDLDLITTGQTTDNAVITNIYRNERQVVMPPPAAPRVASAVEDDGSVVLEWSAPESAEGYNQSVTYNLRVGTKPGASDIVSPMSDPETGFRWISGPGNVASTTTWRIDHLQNGTYYWSVQAMNKAFAPSTFSSEGAFQIVNGRSVANEEDPELPNKFAVHPNYPNPFSSSTNIQVDLPRPATVKIKVYSLLGREMLTLRDGPVDAGRHMLAWDGRDASGMPVGSGVYFYEMRAEGRVFTGKMTLVR